MGTGHWPRGEAVLLTGATGLLGGHVAAALALRGERVVALLRDEVPEAWIRRTPAWDALVKVRGDVLDGALLTRILHDYDIGGVIHLAAQTQVGVAWRDPLQTFEANVRGTWTLMEAVRSYGRRPAVLLASSDKAYGPSEDLPYTEEHPHRPTHPYDASKSCAEVAARAWAASYAIPLVVTRCANLYGPGDLNFERLIPGTLRALLRGERPVVRSDGTPTRDYVYAPDAAAALTGLLDHPGPWAGEAYNVGTGQPVSVLEVVAAAAQAVGRADLLPDVRGEAVGELAHQSLSSARIAAATGWRATTSLADGLARTAPWYGRWGR